MALFCGEEKKMKNHTYVSVKGQRLCNENELHFLKRTINKQYFHNKLFVP